MGENGQQGSGDKKLTKPQLRVLEKMLAGENLHFAMGIRRAGSYRLRSKEERGLGEKIRNPLISNLMRLKVFKLISDPAWTWRDAEYTISDRGRELVRLTNGNEGSDGL